MNTKQPLALRLADRIDYHTEYDLELAGTGIDEQAAAELRRLHNVKLAFDEWIDKTEWVQSTGDARELGKHRADVMRERVERLHSENEWLRGVLAHVKATLPDDVLNGHLKTMIDSTLQRG